MKKFLLGSGLFLSPVIALAQTEITTITGFINRLQSVINVIIPFLIGLAVLVIIYGVLTYIASAGNEEKRKEAKGFIIWGFIGAFIMLSVWGIINILVTSFATDADPVRNAVNDANPLVNPVTVPVTPAGTTF